MSALISLVSCLPLGLVRAAGVAVGKATYWCSPTYRRHLRDNLVQAGYDPDRMAGEAAAAVGCQMIEPAWVWGQKPEALDRRVTVDPDTDRKLAELTASRRPLIVMTPHIGCFELLPPWYWNRYLRPSGDKRRITVLYRRPKVAPLEAVFAAGRQACPGVDLAAADLAGVRRLLRAARSGGILGILPDQVPGHNEGTWARFFGRWAYTMTLPTKLARMNNAATLYLWARRTPGGWHVKALFPEKDFSGAADADARLLNEAVEAVVRDCPEQYLWGYNRYKHTPPQGLQDP